MDKMVDHVFVFEGDGVVKDILGNYTEYRKQQKAQIKKQKAVAAKAKVQENELTPSKRQNQRKRKLSFKEKEEFQQLEKDLEKLEIEKSTLTEGLSDESNSNAELFEMGTRLGEVVKQIDAKTERWMQLAELE